MKKSSTSWGIIALWLFLFFPVGIFFVVKKMTSEKFNYIKNGKALRILGYISLGFAVIYLINLILAFTVALETENASSIVGVVITVFIFGGCGALCIFKGTEYIKRGAKYNRYVSIINTSHDLLLDNIAASVPTTYDKAVADIQAMLNAGFFANAYLDLNKRELIMPKAKAQPNAVVNNISAKSAADTADNRPYPIKCPNCGAPNTILSGAENECEYCGSPL